MPIKVGFVSLGCSKNQIDTEYMLGDLSKSKEFTVVSDDSIADVVVINTCAFIEAAKKEAISTILEFIEKKKNGLKAVIVTGCLAQRYKEEILENFPELDAVLGINSQAFLKDAIISCIKNKKFERFDKFPCCEVEKKRILTTPQHYAYLKIAEGCSNFCSYCAIPKIRGPFKSRPIEEILKEAKWLEKKNIKELILIAQNTSYYGIDLYKKTMLEELLKQLSNFNFKWIRFLYAYPEKIEESLIKTIASKENILPYFDIPIQHINDEILKKMNRKTNKKQILEKIEMIRTILKNSTIRTSLIVGFPGETEKQFKELLNFVEEIEFDRLGCFCYSREEGTKAFNLENQIDEKTKKERQKLIYEKSEEILNKKSLNEISKILTVIVDKKENENLYIGRTKKDAPEVDCVVFFTSKKPVEIGSLKEVKITKFENGDLFGELKN